MQFKKGTGISASKKKKKERKYNEFRSCRALINIVFEIHYKRYGKPRVDLPQGLNMVCLVL